MTDAPPTPPNQILFHYIKSAHFRVVHADGIVGALTPKGLLHLTAYSERMAIPQTALQEVSPEGALGKIISKTGREGIVRELEVDLMMDLNTADALRTWLGERLEEARRVGAFSPPDHK